MFLNNYKDLDTANPLWNSLQVTQSETYNWDKSNTYIKNPPFFEDLSTDIPQVQDIKSAYCLLNLGDSITTDHISPAGKISQNSPAARYLLENGVEKKDFNTYGARRGNYEVMARGTFANIRLINKMVKEVGPNTIHVPTGQ